MTNIMVTGGFGFIGSCLIKYLINLSAPNTKVINVDYLGYGSHPGNLDQSIIRNDNYIFVNADINDIETIGVPFNDIGIDIIVNVAAETHVDRSISEPSKFIRSNYGGTFSLLEYARHRDIDKFIQISTDEVYGEALNDYSFNERDALNPSSPYSSSKAAADLLVMSYFRTYGIDTVVTRCTNNFGPNQFPEKLVPRAVLRAVLGLPILLYGSGNQTRDWLYVNDHIRAIETVMSKGRPGQIYNISASNHLSNLELAHKILLMVKEQSGKSTTIELIQDRPGHDHRYSLDSTKIRSELGWRPETDLDIALRDTVKWYLDNREWWQNLIHPFVVDSKPWNSKK
jgi:dTDP-glucose 4,6-dehydratase